MNCRNFAVIVSEFVRSELMEATVQEEARAHAAACPRCQSRLADEKELAKGLQALALADREKSASFFDESKLRSAFKESVCAAERAVDSAVVAPARSFHAARVWWGLAVAASVTLLVGGILLWRSSDVTAIGPITGVSPTPLSGSEKPLAGNEPLDPAGHKSQVGTNVGRKQRVRAIGSRAGVRPVSDLSYVAVSMGEFQPLNAEPEEVTDFFPMAQGADGGAMTSGQVVRVVMPRNAMTYFGLPMNVNRSDEKVKADVLLGEDGLARAIRFVR